jgi:DNA-binding response OmpR family regulator
MKRKILLIEDEQFIRDLYKDVFDADEFDVDAVETGEKGLTAAAQAIYEAVLLDIILPDINGLDVLKKIKEDEKIRHVPVILLTNLDQDIIVRQGFSLGASGYLIKVSYTPDQVVEEVKKILQGKK